MLDWKKYFDHIFCIHYVNNDRYEHIYNEFKRVGIIDSGIFEFMYDVNTKFSDDLTKTLPSDYHTNGNMRVTYQHYKIWKISKKLNFNRILILEDDICFLKDINRIIDILDNFDFKDISLFDYLFTSKNIDGSYFNSSCYSINQNGMDALIYNLEKNMYTVADRLFFTSDKTQMIYNCGIANKIYVKEIIKNYYVIDNNSYELNTCIPRLGIQNTVKYESNNPNDNTVNYDDYNLY